MIKFLSTNYQQSYKQRVLKTRCVEMGQSGRKCLLLHGKKLKKSNELPNRTF
jgi:hypothetical protein